MVIPASGRKGLCTNLWQIITYQQCKQKDIFTHTHKHTYVDNHKQHRYMRQLVHLYVEKSHTEKSVLERLGRENNMLDTFPNKLRAIFLVLRLYRCLLFGHATLFDRHFRMPGRIVWKICRIPWTSVRWGGMSLMYASGRAPWEVISSPPLRSLDGEHEQHLAMHTSHIVWITAGRLWAC